MKVSDPTVEIRRNQQKKLSKGLFEYLSNDPAFKNLQINPYMRHSEELLDLLPNYLEERIWSKRATNEQTSSDNLLSPEEQFIEAVERYLKSAYREEALSLLQQLEIRFKKVEKYKSNVSPNRAKV